MNGLDPEEDKYSKSAASYRNNVVLAAAMVVSFAFGKIITTTPPPLAQSSYAAASLRAHADDQQQVFLQFPPSTKEIVINIGSNLDPILPAYSMGPCAHSIAVEPIIGCEIVEHRQLSVIHAAVSDKAGVATMFKYNDGGQSSSFAKAAMNANWNTNKERNDGKHVIVPVITLSSFLNAIPSTVKISFLKTDMQGFDYAAIKEAGTRLVEKGVYHISSEVWYDDVYSYDAANDFCRDWLPLMTELGYVLSHFDGVGNRGGIGNQPANMEKVEAQCQEQLKQFPERPTVEQRHGLSEGNAWWVHRNAIDVPFPDTPLNYQFDNNHFTEEDYATCV